VSATDRAPFQRLAKMIERELELAGQGRLTELEEAVRRTGEFMATLPVPAPAGARASIERSKALRGRVTIEVTRLREQLQHSREALKTARRVSRTYSQAPSGRYSTSA
jgi:hypothetical protein